MIQGFSTAARREHAFVESFGDRDYTVHWPSAFLWKEVPRLQTLPSKLSLPQLACDSIASLGGQSGNLAQDLKYTLCRGCNTPRSSPLQSLLPVEQAVVSATQYHCKHKEGFPEHAACDRSASWCISCPEPAWTFCLVQDFSLR